MKKSLGKKTLILPTPTLLVGTYDSAGKANLITIAWGGVCSSNPPSVAVSLQRPRYSYESILEQQVFSVNIPSAKWAEAVDFCGVASGRDHDKFKDSGLTAIKHEEYNVPIVQEFPMTLICKVIHTHDLGSHIQFVGEIMDVLVDEDKLNEKGLPDIRLIDPLVYDTAGKGYFKIGERVLDAFKPVKK